MVQIKPPYIRKTPRKKYPIIKVWMKEDKYRAYRKLCEFYGLGYSTVINLIIDKLLTGEIRI